jgi:phosphohistidine phosphatase SixA
MLALLKAVTLSAAIVASDSGELKPDSLLKVLKKGGYTVLLRHARTDMTSVDEQPYSLTDRMTQRNLSGAGVADSKTIGRVMKAAGIPFGEILSSPMFRTVETAQMAFGTPTTTQLLRQMNETPDQRAVFTKAPAAGTNRALVTHHFLIEHYIPGITPGAVGESEGVVYKTDAEGKIKLIGRFKLADWAKLPGGEAPNTPVFQGHGAAGGSGYLQPVDGSPATVKPFVWDATPATKVGGLYLHNFNTGDEVQMRAFIEKYLLVDANRTTEARLETYRQMFKDHGTITPIGTESATESVATIRAKSKRGEFNLIIALSPTDPTRAASIRIEGRQ